MPDGGGWDVTPDLKQFNSAFAWFEKRVVLSADDALALSDRARNGAFWIGAGVQLNQIQSVFDKLAVAIATGESFESFRMRVRGELTSQHAETVFRNATQRALNAGRYEEMHKPAQLARRPYGLFWGIRDSKQSPICRFCHGTLLPLGDAWWETHQPPLHHRCRSTIRNITRSEAKRRGITDKPPKFKVRDGFGLPLTEIWKPDSKKYDKELFTELKRKEKVAAKRPPKFVPKPVPNSLLRERANELAAALESRDDTKARSMIREAIIEQFPGAVSKDIARGLPGRGAYEVTSQAKDINGTHGWDGTISVSQETIDLAARALRLIAKGDLDTADGFESWRSGEFRSDYLRRVEALRASEALRTLTHEEIHGFSRMIGRTYRGADAVLEEIGTELSARYVVSRMTPAATRFLGNLEGAAYETYIESAQEIVARHTGVPNDLHKATREVREQIVQAHAKSVMGEGQNFSSKHEQLGALADGLGLTAKQRAAVVVDFEKLKATHLPEFFRD